MNHETNIMEIKILIYSKVTSFSFLLKIKISKTTELIKSPPILPLKINFPLHIFHTGPLARDPKQNTQYTPV